MNFNYRELAVEISMAILNAPSTVGARPFAFSFFAENLSSVKCMQYCDEKPRNNRK
jgi:hypothetical protein